MAVYTQLSKAEITNFFTKYELGEIKNFEGIKEGIENTNYIINSEKDKFILTIYEKRVSEEDIPFFIGLMKNLFNSNFKCPNPIINKNGSYISEISNKKAAVVSFIEGESKEKLSPQNCYDIGVETAKLQKITEKLSIKRKNIFL
jgi:Putative homoserine kinase type II (protein kinase fold)